MFASSNRPSPPGLKPANRDLEGLTLRAHGLLIDLFVVGEPALEVTDQVAQILVTREDGEIFWNETVTPGDFRDEHFRRCLADRLGWAATDAEAPSLQRAMAFRDMSAAAQGEPAAG